MSEQFRITPADLGCLPARLIAAYELWKQGANLRATYPRANFYHYRSDFLKLCIDVAVRQPSKPDNVMHLIRALRPKQYLRYLSGQMELPYILFLHAVSTNNLLPRSLDNKFQMEG
ncbi:MAG: phage/plasmid replication domain-containing protein [Methylophilus sp.]